jgi:serine protease
MFPLLVAASLLAAQPTPVVTRCQFTTAQVGSTITDRHLGPCSIELADNLLWHLDRSDSVSGYLDGQVTRRTTGKGAVVYVCDTGVLAAHQEFQRDGGGNAVVGGINAIAEVPQATCLGNPATNPCFGSETELIIFTHGTAVASVVAGKNIGVAPDAKIVAIRIQGNEADWMIAMKKVIEHAYAEGTPPFKTAIINISGGVGFSTQPQFEAMIRKMIAGVDKDGNPDPNGKKFLFVVAAGNVDPRDARTNKPAQCAADLDITLMPGNLGKLDGLVTVGGITSLNELWAGSCFGAAVDVLAPAADMFVASIAGIDQYRYLPLFYNSGTSYATPYVSGMAARILEEHPDYTPAEIEAKLKMSPSIVHGLPVPVDPVQEPAPVKRRSLH